MVFRQLVSAFLVFWLSVEPVVSFAADEAAASSDNADDRSSNSEDADTREHREEAHRFIDQVAEAAKNNEPLPLSRCSEMSLACLTSAF